MMLLPHQCRHKLPQHLRRRIIGEAEIVIQLVVIRFLGAKEGGGDGGLLRDCPEALGLDAGVGMIVHIEDQKGRDAPGRGVGGDRMRRWMSKWFM